MRENTGVYRYESGLHCSDSIKISMIPYIKNVLKGFPEEIMGTAAIPAADYLFEIWDDTNLIKLHEN